MHLKAGWYFEVEFHDVNKNGKVDILTTTWSRSEEFGQTIGYELNARDWKNPESWIKQTHPWKELINFWEISWSEIDLNNLDTAWKSSVNCCNWIYDLHKE